jgi:putative transposase
VKYNPDKHHRQSIRLKGYDYTSPGAYFITICSYQRECLLGEIVDGEMQLNQLGNVVRSHWIKLPTYHSHLQLDAWVVMPNHVHGILILTHNGVGAGLGENISVEPMNLMSKPAPTGQSINTPRAGLGENISVEPMNLMSKPAPTGHYHGIPEIIRGFKTFSARRINEIRKVKGIPVWQRNYYEHIIRNEESLQHLRQYIHNNPLSWWEDQLHPDVPSTW